MLFSIETHLTCDFPDGSGRPPPPLDPHSDAFVHQNAIRFYPQFSSIWVYFKTFGGRPINFFTGQNQLYQLP